MVRVASTPPNPDPNPEPEPEPVTRARAPARALTCCGLRPPPLSTMRSRPPCRSRTMTICGAQSFRLGRSILKKITDWIELSMILGEGQGRGQGQG